MPNTALQHCFDDWQDGWCQGAQACKSPNFGARPSQAVIDLIVVHSISLPPGVYGGGEVQQLFTNQLNWDAHPYFQSIRALKFLLTFSLSALAQFGNLSAATTERGMLAHPPTEAGTTATTIRLALSSKALKVRCLRICNTKV